MGLYLLIKLSIKERKRKVILSAYTIPDVINMAVLAGGEPVFVDFNPRSTNVDVNHLETLIEDDVAALEWLRLHPAGNRRARFTPDTGTWLVP